MTLIAQLSVNGAPFLVGDVLLSSETRTGLKVNLPLIGDINQILADRGFAFEVRFAQKLNIFNGSIAVAWSGPLIQAERALRVLEAISSQTNLTRSDMFGELNAMNHDAIDQLQLIGLLLEEVSDTTAKSSLFSIRVRPEHVPNFGTVCTAGSGRDAFIHMLQKGNYLSQTNANEYQVAHALLGALTNEEFRTGNTILNRWGGGFEALTFSPKEGRFEKVGDILHTFWLVKEHSGESLRIFPFFYKTTYWRDALVLRTASLDVSKDDKLTLKTNDFELIPSLLKTIDDYDLTELGSVDFSYRAVCCHVLIEKQYNRDLLLLNDQRESGHDFLFHVDESDCQLHVSDYLPNIIRERLKQDNCNAISEA